MLFSVLRSRFGENVDTTITCGNIFVHIYLFYLCIQLTPFMADTVGTSRQCLH